MLIHENDHALFPGTVGHGFFAGIAGTNVAVRLALEAGGFVLQEAADAMYIDVTGNSTPDSTPVGSINRARWRAEVASREARQSNKDTRFGATK